jgi:uncharacterized protein YaiI (UPF0178 family)
VKEEIVEIATKHSIEVIFIASYAHMKVEQSDWKWKYVDSSKEAVDLFIMNAVKQHDVVITQDIGLASTLLLKNVYVLSPRGIIMDEKDINIALDLRYLSAKARRRGIYGKGPKPFSDGDRQRFKRNLIRILSNIAGE